MDVDAIIEAIIQNPLYIIGGAVCLILLIIVIRQSSRMPYRACDALLTKSELRFYNVIKHCVPATMIIMMKVRMADIINCDDRDWKRGWGPKISAKHVDFVLIDKTDTTIQLAIELDDSTHRTQKQRIERDLFVNKAFETANVALLRVNVQKYYDRGKLKTLISQSIG